MKTKNSLFASIIVVLLSIIGFFFYTISTVEEKYELQINSRDSLIRAIEIQDSIYSLKEQQNQNTVEKYISDCNILINGQKVSTEELVKYLNDRINEIQNLEDNILSFEDSIQKLKMKLSIDRREHENILDSLQVYKAYYALIKRKGFDFEINEQNGTRTVAIKQLKTDSLYFYKKAYEYIKQDYGISYIFETSNNGFVFKRPRNKVDTALAYYEQLKKQ